MEVAVCYPEATVSQPWDLAQYASYCQPTAAESTRHGNSDSVAYPAPQSFISPMADRRLIFANTLATRRRWLVPMRTWWNTALPEHALDGTLSAVLIIQDRSRFTNRGSGSEYIVASLPSAECQGRNTALR